MSEGRRPGLMQVWRRLRLSQKVGLAVLASCIPLVVLGVQVANIASSLLQDQVLNNVGLAGQVEAERVSASVDRASDGVQSLSRDTRFQDLVAQQSELGAEVAVNTGFQEYLDIVVGRFEADGLIGLEIRTNAGTEISAVNTGTISAETSGQLLQMGDVSSMVGSVFIDMNGRARLPIFERFRPGGGGVGVTIVSEWDVQTLLRGGLDLDSLGESAKSMVLQPNPDGTNDVISRTDSELVGQIRSISTNPVLDQSSPVIETEDQFGTDVVQASSRTNVEPAWITVVEVDQSDVYRDLGRVRMAVITVFVAAGLVILAVIMIAFRGFARRLARMTNLAESVASGDLTVRTGDDRLDELGRLSMAFDDMTEALAHDIARRERVEAQLAYQATHDSLTGLPNRHQLIEELDQLLMDSNELLSVLFVDLDGFKEVNDRHGHGAGDELLVRVAERLRDVLRPNDFLARLGGDEFVIVLGGLGLMEAERLAGRVVASLELPFIVVGVEVGISASIGVSSATDERSSERLIKEADIAMYRAKAMGKGRAVRVTEESLVEVEQRVSILTELREAVNNGDLQLMMWPVGDLRLGRLTGMEATVRWHHAERGIIPPAEFLPMAVDSGFATQIDEWVISKSLQTFADWRDDGLPVDDLEMSINLTTEMFLDPRSRQIITSELDRHKLRSSNFRIEVPETVLRSDGALLKDVFNTYRAIGMPVTLDRFGSDYSSLDRLPRFAIDAVKIDLALIADLGNRLSSRALVGSLITLAQTAGLRVAAAGVDDDLLRQELIELGCHNGQGLWISPLVDPVSMADLLAARRMVDAF